jgi:hypothetical protein
MIQHGYMNLYRSGFYHRKGKAGACDAHGGDVYLDYADAVAQAEPDRGYFATIPIQWDAEDPIARNPDDSVPIPISVSRKEFA